MTSPADRLYETVIIGGGIAGLACARQLHDNARPFLLITKDVGGRILESEDGGVNLGAYYVTSDYSHVNQYVDRGRRIRRSAMLRGDQDGSFKRGDLPLLRHPVQAIRFLRLIRDFRRHYETFKRNCLLMSQADALKADPMLWDLYHEEFLRFIDRKGIENIARSYLAPAVHGTAFTSTGRLTAMTFLVLVLPVIVPIFEYTFRPELLTGGFEDAVLFDEAIGITRADGHYRIETRGGDVRATNVVVATPIDTSARMLDLGDVKKPISAHMFLIAGELRRPWSKATFSLFPEGETTFGIACQAEGSILFVSASRDPEFAEYFTSWEVLEHHYWNPAFNPVGDELLECRQGPGLYVIGDHNVCNLEDAYITGVYAAQCILEDPGAKRTWG